MTIFVYYFVLSSLLFPQIYSSCFPLNGAILNSNEIRRVQNQDCCQVCEEDEVCNFWARCLTSEGCRLGITSLVQNECLLYHSDEVATGSGFEVVNVSSTETGFFQHAFLPPVRLTNGIEFISTNVGLTVMDDLSVRNDVNTFSMLANSPNLNDVLQVDFADPDYFAIICIPTDSAFLQFFDNMGFTLGDLMNDTLSLNTLMMQNIIPGSPASVPQIPGQSIMVPSLLFESNITIMMNSETPRVKIKTTASVNPAVKLSHTDLSTELQTWTLDQVLVPPMFMVQSSLLGQTVMEVVRQKPGLDILSSLLSSELLSYSLRSRLSIQNVKDITFYAPVDNLFQKYFEQTQTTLEELLSNFAMLNELVDSLLVESGDGETLQNSNPLNILFKNSENDVTPFVTSKIDLGMGSSVLVIRAMLSSIL